MKRIEKSNMKLLNMIHRPKNLKDMLNESSKSDFVKLNDRYSNSSSSPTKSYFMNNVSFNPAQSDHKQLISHSQIIDANSRDASPTQL
jgi:hypothetical protein